MQASYRYNKSTFLLQPSRPNPNTTFLTRLKKKNRTDTFRSENSKGDKIKFRAYHGKTAKILLELISLGRLLSALLWLRQRPESWNHSESLIRYIPVNKIFFLFFKLRKEYIGWEIVGDSKAVKRYIYFTSPVNITGFFSVSLCVLGM